MRITGYTYRADIFCPDDIKTALRDGISGHGPFDWNADAETVLDQVATANGIDRYNEETFDSGEFPKVIFSTDDDGLRCGACGEEI